MGSKIITDLKIIKRIIDTCDACYVAMVDKENKPYVLPFNFGYDGQFIYLHSAATGKKNDILKNNSNVCVAFSTDHQLFHRNEEVACSYGMKFRSVVAFGKVKFITDYDKKIEVLNKVMEKYSANIFNYNEPAVKNVETFIVEIENITAKELGY